MKQNTRTGVMVWLTLGLSMIAGLASADSVEFNYEGRVKISGLAYTGPGYFKLAIVSQNGQVSLWSNDGTSNAGNEPATAVVTSVTDGLFNIIVGDTSIPNMLALDASIFNYDDTLKLRVWFSDTGSGAFEQLHPDRKITSASILGSQSFDLTHLYVDPVNGDDRFSGLTPLLAKQTIQAAWDTLPPLLHESATIHLADGIYRQQALLSGKSVIGGASIAILGDPASPADVRITGAEEGAETTPVVEYGFTVDEQTRLHISGVAFDNFIRTGLLVDEGSSVEAENCTFSHGTEGFWIRSSRFRGSSLSVFDDYTGVTDTRGMRIDRNSNVILRDCSVTGFDHGLSLGHLSYLTISGSTADNCDYGHVITGNCYIIYELPKGTLTGNTYYGIYASMNSSVVRGTIYNNFSGNGTNVYLTRGAEESN